MARLQAGASLTEGVASITPFAPVFGDLGNEPRFVAAVTRQSQSLRRRGVETTLQDWR